MEEKENQDLFEKSQKKAFFETMISELDFAMQHTTNLSDYQKLLETKRTLKAKLKNLEVDE